ncbi:unnamed protein product [Symbiodinium necroappetens]|uniref:Uncharacterized protein n=1 Tax=Symbiodinium necroappetens TaxID=1628268 RepID=A0A813CDL0_9DINO|nr:unnamed protein product [Symbiodinium necroappetens]
MDDATLFRNFLELQNVTDTPEKEADGDITPTEPEDSQDEGSGSEPAESDAEGSQDGPAKPAMSFSDPVWQKHAAKVRRLCNPTSKRPKLKVSAELARRFLRGSKHERDTLIKMMMDLGGEKDGLEQFVKVAEKFIEKETKKGEYTVVAGFYSIEAMKKDLKWPELLYCIQCVEENRCML